MTRSRSSVSIGPLHTKSLRHLPPDPSCLLFVPLLASKTGRVEVDADPGLNWILHGSTYWTSLFMNLSVIAVGSSSRNIMYFFSISLSKAATMADLVSSSLKYLRHCDSRTLRALSSLLLRKSFSLPRSGRVHTVLPLSQSRVTDFLISYNSDSSRNDILSTFSVFLQSRQFLHRTHR